MSYIKSILLLISAMAFIGCSGVSLIGNSKSNLYSDDFMKKINEVKEIYRKGNTDEAFLKLKGIQEEGLFPTEKALRRNLMGVLAFSKSNFEQAIFNFDLALTTSRLDESLTSQIYLNLSSTYFKLGFMEKASDTIDKVNYKQLQANETRKYFKLSYKLAKELGQEKKIATSLIGFLRQKQNLSELKSEPFFEILVSYFFKLDSGEKVRMLEEMEKEAPLCIAYLAYLDAEKKYYKGQKDEATELLEWVKDKFASNAEIEMLIQNFLFRVENYAKMNPKSIGVILPLTGQKGTFGKRALMGIDNAINASQNNFDIHITDSEGSGAVGRFRVRELIEKHYVSVIVGGLFSQEATKEYLEAKRHGVFFISLSQIYLPKEQKDHLLLEIPGSIESQVAQVLSEATLSRFGKRAAIIYPKSPRGEAYVNEFWRSSRLKGIDVSSIQSYEKNKTDYRDPVRNILGLKFTRERQEEHDMLSDIYNLQKNKSIRRIQVLKPQVDFDWLFIPAFPKEALQIIPSFTYFDAFKLNIIGDPSWRSKALARESYKLVNLYFVGDDVSESSEKFSNDFYERYKSKPRIIEMIGFDSFSIVNAIMQGNSFKSRDELDIHIRSQEEIKGMTGSWKLIDGVWIKKMVSHQLKRGKVEKLEPVTQI